MSTDTPITYEMAELNNGAETLRALLAMERENARLREELAASQKAGELLSGAVTSVGEELAEAKVCISNQKSMLNGKHEYIGQDFKMRMQKLTERAEQAEAELSTYRQWAEVEIANLRDDMKRLHTEKMDMYERALAAEKDAWRLDWYEQQHGLHTAVEIMYVVDGYDLALIYDSNVKQEFHGDTLRSAIDAAIKWSAT